MNKKILAIGFLSAVVAGSVLLTSSVSAFWPFDSLFNKGSVKAAAISKEVQNNRFMPEEPRQVKMSKAMEAMKPICDNLFAPTKAKPKSGNKEDDFTVMGGEFVGVPKNEKITKDEESLQILMNSVCKRVKSHNERFKASTSSGEMKQLEKSKVENAKKSGLLKIMKDYASPRSSDNN